MSACRGLPPILRAAVDLRRCWRHCRRLSINTRRDARHTLSFADAVSAALHAAGGDARRVAAGLHAHTPRLPPPLAAPFCRSPRLLAICLLPPDMRNSEPPGAEMLPRDMAAHMMSDLLMVQD